MFGVYVPITPSDISRLRLKWGYISEAEYWNNVQFDAEHLAWCRAQVQGRAQVSVGPGFGPFAAFHGAEVNFKPTYKFDFGTNAHDTSSARSGDLTLA